MTNLALTIDPREIITSTTERADAVEQLAGVQTLRRNIKAHYQSLKAPAAETTRALNAAEAAHLAPVLDAETQLQDSITTYDATQKADAETAMREAMEAGTPMPTLVAVPRQPGEQQRTTYRAEGTNLRTLVEAVAAGEVELGALVPHGPTLNKLARRDREQFTVPGCTLATRTQVITR